MTTLAERLKAKTAREKTVEIDGDNYLIKSIGRIEKINLIERCSKKGKIDEVRFEAEYLAACVFDPNTGEHVDTDWKNWDIPSYIADPLVEAVMEVNGLRANKVDVVKKLAETEN